MQIILWLHTFSGQALCRSKVGEWAWPAACQAKSYASLTTLKESGPLKYSTELVWTVWCSIESLNRIALHLCDWKHLFAPLFQVHRSTKLNHMLTVSLTFRGYQGLCHEYAIINLYQFVNTRYWPSVQTALSSKTFTYGKRWKKSVCKTSNSSYRVSAPLLWVLNKKSRPPLPHQGQGEQEWLTISRLTHERKASQFAAIWWHIFFNRNQLATRCSFCDSMWLMDSHPP